MCLIQLKKLFKTNEMQPPTEFSVCPTSITEARCASFKLKCAGPYWLAKK